MKVLQRMYGIALNGQHVFRNEIPEQRKCKNSIVYKGIADINKKYAGNKK